VRILSHDLRTSILRSSLCVRSCEIICSYHRSANLPESSGRSRFVPVPQAKTGIKPGNGKRETQPGNVMPGRFSARSGSLYTDSQSHRPISWVLNSCH